MPSGKQILRDFLNGSLIWIAEALADYTRRESLEAWELADVQSLQARERETINTLLWGLDDD